MSKNALNERICVGAAGGARSNVWRLFSTGGDVYVTSGTARVEKISFHKSLICRRAFTAEHGTPSGMDDRVMHRWKRNPTPSEGSNQATLALKLFVPTDFLSTALAPLTKKVTWINPSIINTSTVIEMFFTNDTKAEFAKISAESGRKLEIFSELPNGEKFAVTSCSDDFSGQEFRVPTSMGHKTDIVFSKQTQVISGRPTRITIFNKPNDGDTLIAHEYGGYKPPVIALLNNPGMDRLDRKGIYDRKWSGMP